MANETILRTSGVCTTILGVLNQFQAFTDLIYNALPNTTLNSKYKVLNDITEPPFTPALKYFGIGTRGYQNIDMNQSALPFPGDARCMDLYSPLPFRCIPVDEESDILSPTERAKYRMRVVQTYNGVEYACYYLKLIDFSTKSVEIVKKDADGYETPFDLDPAWLTPQPPTLNQVGGNIDTNVNRIIVRATGVCTVTHEEIMEAVSVIHNNDSNFARISELGYYTGCDVGVDANGVVVADDDLIVHNEAAYVQLAKMHCFRGSELFTAGSYITPTVSLESECCINGNLSNV